MAKMVVFLVQPLLAEGVISGHPRAVGVRIEYRPRLYGFIRTHGGSDTLTGNYLFGNLDAVMMA
jgi:hypothetical protein